MLPWKACETGDSVDAIDTPALILDLDAFERNLRLMAKESASVRLRPHAKSHKCPQIALAQIRLGAVGICCQKLSEAAVFAKAGVNNILVTNQLVGQRKLEHVRDLAESITLGVLVDHAQHVQDLARVMAGCRRELDVYVELDVGAGRCGASIESSVVLARQIHASDGLRFAGLHAYHGAAQHLRKPEERAAAIRHATAIARRAREQIEAVGMTVPVVTGAGTGTFWHERDSGVYNEVQPGSYALMDRDYSDNEPGLADVRFEHALFVLSTVLSRPVRDVAVVDAGLKASSVDSGMPRIWKRNDLQYQKASDEHGVVKILSGGDVSENDVSGGVSVDADPGAGTTADATTRPASSREPRLGDTLWLIPGHCDPTVNLYDDIICVRQGKVEAIWPVSARGACL